MAEAAMVRGVELSFQPATCIVCDNDDPEPAGQLEYQGTKLAYALCRCCGHLYMNPRPTRQWYHQFYRDDFWKEQLAGGWARAIGSRGCSTHAEKVSFFLRKQDERTRRLWQAVSDVELEESSLVLEVGSSWGRTLRFIREQTGASVLAVEPSAVASDYAQRYFGVERLARFYEEVDGQAEVQGRCSLLIFSHSLENIVNPLGALRTARRLLTPNGHLYVDTPNFYYNDARNPYHPNVFRPETLAALLAAAGFRGITRIAAPHPARAQHADDIYLRVLAVAGEPTSLVPQAQPAELLEAQRKGLQLIEESILRNMRRTGLRRRLRTLLTLVPSTTRAQLGELIAPPCGE